MIRKENEKAEELTDDDIEKAAGGGERVPVAKRCIRCESYFTPSDSGYYLDKCPTCGWDKFYLVYDGVTGHEGPR